MVSIINGENISTFKPKIEQAISLGNISSVGVQTWGDIRVKLNQVAILLERDLIENKENGLSARNKINSILSGPKWAYGMDLAFDFVNGRAWKNKIDDMNTLISDIWSGGLVKTSTGYINVATNVLARSTLGLQTVPTRTNLFLNSAAPVTQSVPVVNGTVYTISVIGAGTVTLTGAGTGVASMGVPITITAVGTSLTTTITNLVTYVQVEAGSFATPPIITAGTPVTRTGNVTTLSLPITAQEGISGILTVDTLGFNSNDLPIILGINPATKLAQTIMEVSNEIPIAVGLKTIVFAASPGYAKIRVLGDVNSTTAINPNYDTGIVSLSIGGNGFDTSNNLYAIYKNLGLKFGVQNNTTFDEVYTMATLIV